MLKHNTQIKKSKKKLNFLKQFVGMLRYISKMPPRRGGRELKHKTTNTKTQTTMKKEIIEKAVEALKLEAATMRAAVKQICEMASAPAVAPLAEMLGLNAESTKRYRDNVASKLTSKIPYYREVVTPDGKGIITLAYRMAKKSNGYFAPVEVDFWSGLVDAICNDECKHVAIDVNAYYDAEGNIISADEIAAAKEAKASKSADNKRKNALKTLNISSAIDALKLALELAAEEEKTAILNAIATLAK